MSEFLTTLGIIVALFLSIYNFYNSILSHRRKRQKLINTVYYHVIHARESLQGQKKGNKSIRERESGIITPTRLMRLVHLPMTSPMIT